MLIIALLTVIIVIGLGYWNYTLGRSGKSNRTGLIIPGVYLLIRLLLTVVVGRTIREVLASILGSVIFGVIYYALFKWGQTKRR